MPGDPASDDAAAPPVPPQVLALLPAPHQRSIYHHPPAARNAARLAAAFLAAAGGEHTESGLFRAFPDMGASTLHFYLARWRDAGAIAARPAPELKASSTGRPVLAYSLAPEGKTPLGEYVQYYIRQIEGLAGRLGTVRKAPGTGRHGTAQVPALTPLEACLLLVLYRNSGPGAASPGHEILGDVSRQTGAGAKLLRNATGKLVGDGLVARTPPQGKPGRKGYFFSLTSRGRTTFPAVARNLWKHLARAHEEVEAIMGAEAGHDPGR